MKCQEVQELLSAYIDSELSAGQKDCLEAHLNSCESCAVMFQELLLVKKAVSNMKRREAPEPLKDRIEKLSEQIHAKRKNKFVEFILRVHPVASAASAAAVFILVTSAFFLFFSKSSTADIIQASAECHSRYLSGNEKMQFDSRNPDQVKEWLCQQLDTPVTLPEITDASSGQVMGSTVRKVMGVPAGIVNFKNRDNVVTLVVFKVDPNKFERSVSRTSFRVYNGRRILYEQRKSCRVILWRNRNVVYSAVSKMPHERLVRFIPDGRD